MKRSFMVAACTAAIALTCSLSAFAGQWNYSQYGWWYDQGDGTFAANGWKWIDGNNDGIAECYYFNEYGYCVPWSITPDGYLLDGNGAWQINGFVPTQAVPVTPTPAAADTSSQTEEEDPIIGNYTGTYNANQGKTGVDIHVFEEDGDLMAEFIFYNLEGQTNAKEGSFLSYVEKKADGSYEFLQDRWLNKPSGYDMLDWTLTLTNKRLEGHVINNSNYKLRCKKTNK